MQRDRVDEQRAVQAAPAQVHAGHAADLGGEQRAQVLDRRAQDQSAHQHDAAPLRRVPEELHLLPHDQPGQPDRQRGPAAHHRRRQVLRERRRAVLQHGQTDPRHRHLRLQTDH